MILTISVWTVWTVWTDLEFGRSPLSILRIYRVWTVGTVAATGAIGFTRQTGKRRSSAEIPALGEPAARYPDILGRGSAPLPPAQNGSSDDGDACNRAGKRAHIGRDNGTFRVGPETSAVRFVSGHGANAVTHWPLMGFNKRLSQVDRKGRQPTAWDHSSKLPMITVGAVGTKTGLAYIYVGRGGQRLKVGMTSDLDQRARALAIEMLHSWPVAIAGARAVETEVFQIIGHKQGDTEWIVRGVTVDAIVAAVPEAIARVRRWAWVDPDLTEEQARQLRIEMAGVDRSVPVEPPRKPRFSIASFRKAAGTLGS